MLESILRTLGISIENARDGGAKSIEPTELNALFDAEVGKISAPRHRVVIASNDRELKR
jgi:hypothetical protein